MRKVLLALCLLFLNVAICHARDDSQNRWIPINLRDIQDIDVENDARNVRNPYETHSEELKIDLTLSENLQLDLNLVSTPSFAWNSDDFLDKIQFADPRHFDKLRFIGIHRFWIRHVKRFFKHRLEDDREAYIDSSSAHPAIAARLYDEQFQQLKYSNAVAPWSCGRHWFPNTQAVTRTYGSFAPFRQIGPITLTKDLHLRFDTQEMPKLCGVLNSLKLSKRNRTTKNRRERIYTRRDHIQSLRLGFNAGLGGPFGLRIVSMKMSIVLRPIKNKLLAIPCAISVRYNIPDQKMRFKFKILLATF
jgi:hypothetical protein